jgi:hypothetical protein
LYKLSQPFKKFAAVAVVGAMAIVVSAPIASAQAAQGAAAAPANGQPPQKKVKDQGEYDIFNQTLKDASNPAQQIKDLDTWTQKYPDSDYKDDRLVYYLQAYNGANQPGKVLEVGGGLMAHDLKSVLMKDPKSGPQQVLQVLYLMTVNFAKIPNPTPQQMEVGEKAANALKDFVGEYFTAANKPANTSDADWTKSKDQVASLAKAVLMSSAARPGAEAMAKYRQDKNADNCKVAEAAYQKALQQYPDSAAIAFGLGTAEVCLYKVSPDKISPGLWYMARAVAIDPTLGGTSDAKPIEAYLNSTYTTYHGPDDEGLKALKEQAKASPNPPDGFKIKSQVEIAIAKEEEFKKTNPQLALWMGIKKQLADTQGEQYFESSLKSAAVPPLKGTIVEAKPACRSKELVLALSDAKNAEVTLKLDSPLTGKPELGQEIQFEGVPSAFTKDPAFMLTMDAEKAKLEGIKTEPCAAAPARKGPARPAAKKK